MTRGGSRGQGAVSRKGDALTKGVRVGERNN